MEKFVQGNEEFRKGYFVENRSLFKDLETGQNPMAMYLGCSDSRVPMEMITWCQPGDLFALRNMGPLVPAYEQRQPAMVSAIRYAIDILGVEHIIICGHYGCGCMKALLKHTSGEDIHPDIVAWVTLASDLLEKAPDKNLTGRELERDLVRRNVVLQQKKLMEYPAVIEALENGRLTIHPWIYDWRTGMIEEWDREGQSFKPLPESQCS